MLVKIIEIDGKLYTTPDKILGSVPREEELSPKAKMYKDMR